MRWNWELFAGKLGGTKGRNRNDQTYACICLLLLAVRQDLLTSLYKLEERRRGNDDDGIIGRKERPL
jgi:hypothetical protein